ncbi:MAG: single-stranded-DNA-specific exonuclease RecJ [Alphaproteobacteria bacterium]
MDTSAQLLKNQPWTSYNNKKWALKSFDERLYHHLLQSHDLPDIIARLLAQKNIQPDEAPHYLSPKLKDLLPSPASIKNLEQAVDRLYKAFQNKEKITVFGDYDVDGGTSTALLINFFKALDYPLDFYIPDRLTEGYGPNPKAFETIRERGTSLLITVDCGTTAEESLKHAQTLGLDVIVIDHHTCEKAPSLPNTLIINPNQPNDTSGLTYLCAVGVTFMVLVGFVQRLKKENFTPIPDLRHFLDLVALGTVCDMVPLIKLNRAFVRQGLEVFRHAPNFGLKILSQLAQITGPLEAYHLGFVLGPRINAGGRLQDSTLGVRLLTTNSLETAQTIGAQLCQLNRDRQTLENAVFTQAVQQVLEAKSENDPLICVHSDGWHPGVIGITASRLKEHFDKPTCVISFDEKGHGKGSGRSVKGLHLGNLMLDAHKKGFLLNGGGHKMAAGFSLNQEQLPAFRKFLKEHAFVNEEETVLNVHSLLAPTGITLETIEKMDQLAPFGCENPKPKVLLPFMYVDFIQERGESHLACTLKSETGHKVEAMAFRAKGTPLEKALKTHKSQPCHMIGTLKIDHWNGRKKIVFLIDDCLLT